MEELKALTDQMVADGETPWCIGLGSGGATGWPATDWVEDMMLRTQPPEVYDQWVTNEIPFTTRASSPRSTSSAISRATTTTSPAVRARSPRPTSATAPRVCSTAPPQCYMHRQASFIPAFFPEAPRSGRCDFFYFPAYAEQGSGQPVLGAGTLLAITNDPAAHGLMEFLQTPIAHEVWMAQRAAAS
jgi:alpha-glucoside transport system substrate-binding protein